jgi:hypothetical protein
LRFERRNETLQAERMSVEASRRPRVGVGEPVGRKDVCGPHARGDECHLGRLVRTYRDEAAGALRFERRNETLQAERMSVEAKLRMGGGSKMSAQQRMKRAFGIRAVWVGIVLIVFA